MVILAPPTVSVFPVGFQVRFDVAPKLPALLNCTCVLLPAGFVAVPPPPVALSVPPAVIDSPDPTLNPHYTELLAIGSV